MNNNKIIDICETVFELETLECRRACEKCCAQQMHRCPSSSARHGTLDGDA